MWSVIWQKDIRNILMPDIRSVYFRKAGWNGSMHAIFARAERLLYKTSLYAMAQFIACK